MKKLVYIRWGEKYITPKYEIKKGYLPKFKNVELKNSVENLLFSKKFISEFNKEKKSDFLLHVIDTIVFRYWVKCWDKTKVPNCSSRLTEKQANQLIRYFEYALEGDQKGAFRVEVETIKPREHKAQKWHETGRLD